ncbi:MAG: helix-turn-helix transcriptional regulator [Anaerolineae bacterium]|nr:helix-turn-helix transcriptional regulator [Anaerolineae bacterium]
MSVKSIVPPLPGKPVAQQAALDFATARTVAERFKVLSDPTRVRLLAALAERELCVTELTQILDMEQSAVSHQLRALRSSELVRNRRVGRQVYYSLNDHHIRDLLSSGLSYTQDV